MSLILRRFDFKSPARDTDNNRAMMKPRDVLDKLSRRQDSEHKQSLVRLFIVSAAAIYSFAMNGFETSLVGSPQAFLQICILISMLYTVGNFIHIVRNPQIHLTRRFAGMFHDVAAVTLFFHFGGEMSALFLFVYPFSAIGNGFRYGQKWLLISAAMGVTGLGILLTTSPYWKNHSMISMGITFNFVIVITYTALLLRKLRSNTDKLEELATHDSLTGLPNRQLVMDQLRHTLEFNMKGRRTVACVYFDLDGFKHVNDTLGHGAGDFLLQEVGRRTRGLLRDSDLLARLGGDEFTMVLESVQSREDAEIICKKVVRAVEEITEIMGQPIAVSVSVGCVIVTPESLAKDRRATEEMILRQADQCMYQSKKSGSGRYTIAELLPSVGDEFLAA